MHEDVNETEIEHWKVYIVLRNKNIFQLKKVIQNEKNVKLE